MRHVLALVATFLAFATVASAQTMSDAHLAGRSKTVAVSADDQAVTATAVGVILLTSDSATATDRTFTLTASSLVGHKVTLMLNDTSTDLVELADSGIQKLNGGWLPAVRYETITLLSDGTNWNEVSRSVPAASTITSAMITDATVALADLAAPVMKEATGTLTQAQLLAIGTPVVAIAAAGSGTVHVVDEVELFHDYDTAVYATGADLQLQYTTSGDNIALVYDTFVTAGADASVIFKPSTYDLDGSTGTAAGFDVTANANKGVEFTGSNFTDGSAANIIKYRIRYHTVTLAL